MINKKKIILIVLPNLKVGGAEKTHIYLANDWVNKGFIVKILVLNKIGILKDLINKDIEIINLNVHRIRNALFPITRQILSLKPSVIIAPMWPLTCIVAISWLFSLKKGKLILVEHTPLTGNYSNDLNSSFFLTKMSINLTYRFANNIIAVSKGVFNDLNKILNMKLNQLKIINNAVKIIQNKKNPSQIREEYKLNKYSKIILGIGNLKKQKDFVTLIEAFNLLENKSNYGLFIIGEGFEKDRLFAQIKKLKLQNNVFLIGQSLEIYSWLKNADLFVNSSTYDGLPLVIIEALLCGVPVVSTDCISGPAEILDHGKYGKLVQIKDYKKLSEQMELSLSSTIRKEILIKRGNDFNIDKISRQYIELF